MTGPKYLTIFLFEKQDDLVLKKCNRKDGRTAFLFFYVSTSIEQNLKNSKVTKQRIYICVYSLDQYFSCGLLY